jgi:hypothetical protein
MEKDEILGKLTEAINEESWKNLIIITIGMEKQI